MMQETIARAGAVLLLPVLALATVALDADAYVKLGMWLVWLALAVAIDAFAPRVVPIPDDTRPAGNALPLAAVLLQAAVLAYAMWLVSTTLPGPAQMVLMAGALGISGGTVGISAAHELVHRHGKLARGAAQAFMLLVSYPHFPIVHLRVHHPYVGTSSDPGTSRRNESLWRFIGRAFVLSWHSGWRVEEARLARVGIAAWHWRNGIVQGVVLQIALWVLLAWVFGLAVLVFFVAQSVAAIMLTLAVDYTQHYGVVRRENAPGRLERVCPHHAWSSDHASNRSTFNLGLHADHHLKPGLPYPQLANDRAALQTPFGYPGLLLLAFIPSLWYRVMNARLTV